MPVELRQLQAFVAVATQLHFGRAAQELHIGQPTLSELVQRLERELGTPLLTRSTRPVHLTEAGSEFLLRARALLDDAAEAVAVVKRIGTGQSGTVRVGVTPPAAPVLAPHLRATLADVAPEVDLVVARLWLPLLEQALADGTVDVGITCGRLDDVEGMATEVFCAQPLLVGLRPGHPLAGEPAVPLSALADQVRGATHASLFPAWSLAQQQALQTAGISPPTVQLDDPDLVAARWMEHPGVDWILLIGSLTAGHVDTVVRPVTPRLDVPFTVRWRRSRVRTPAVATLVEHLLTMPPAPGFSALSD
ncbi:LysR family transcriptional regulator [Modestobacter sp. NPDC049651]|uniref:LysR family transcriptional regulator n=1 Tax=unclassified Modestobacter TaxID=2643866 RepID=UPI0033F41EFB